MHFALIFLAFCTIFAFGTNFAPLDADFAASDANSAALCAHFAPSDTDFAASVADSAAFDAKFAPSDTDVAASDADFAPLMQLLFFIR